MAVDGSSSTFWVFVVVPLFGHQASLFARAFLSQASALNPSGPVAITVDLGGEKRLSEVVVDWEFPAKAFTLSVSTDGVKWAEVYATDSNILSLSSISLGAVPAAKVRLVMREACRANASFCGGVGLQVGLWRGVVGGSFARLVACVLCACLFAGGGLLPRARCVWDQIVGCPRAEFAQHCGRLRVGR